MAHPRDVNPLSLRQRIKLNIACLLFHAEDGKTYYVPENTTYPKWKADFVDGEKKAAFLLESVPVSTRVNEKPKEVIATDVTKEYEKRATPGQGDIFFEENYNMALHKEEVDFAHWLYDRFGGSITLLNEVNEDGIKTADYIWNGKLWDLKTVTTEKSANSAVRKGMRQIQKAPGGIILDYRGRKIDMKLLKSVIEKDYNGVKVSTYWISWWSAMIKLRF